MSQLINNFHKLKHENSRKSLLILYIYLICFPWHVKLWFTHSRTKKYTFTTIVKNVETSSPKCFEMLPNFLTRQNFWWCAFPPSSYTTGNKTIPSTSDKDGIFAKSSRGDTSRQSAGVHFVKAGISKQVSSQSRDSSHVGSAMCPSCPRKDWQGKFCWQTGKRPRGCLRIRWSDYISDLAWSCLGLDPNELSEIPGDREIFRFLLGMLLTHHPTQSKSGCENEWKIICLLLFAWTLTPFPGSVLIEWRIIYAAWSVFFWLALSQFSSV